MLEDFAALLALLPVRPPMVLVDRVVSLRPNECIEVDKAITSAEPCFLHLAEGLPARRWAFPRSLLLESFGQAAALLWLGSVAAEEATAAGPTGADGSPREPDGARLPMVGSIRGCRYGVPVYPGDVVRHRVVVDRMVEDNAVLSGVTTSAAGSVLEVESLVAVRRQLATVLATGRRQ